MLQLAWPVSNEPAVQTTCPRASGAQVCVVFFQVPTKKRNAVLQFPESDHRPMAVWQLLTLSIAEESSLEPIDLTTIVLLRSRSSWLLCLVCLISNDYRPIVMKWFEHRGPQWSLGCGHLQTVVASRLCNAPNHETETRPQMSDGVISSGVLSYIICLAHMQMAAVLAR